jgi:O-antigen biosynthesis protein WbqV
MVEANPAEGILTNVIGSRNVADAALHARVKAMVQISTDKAVKPSSIMGATKKLAELYCQALDLGRHASDDLPRPRFMTVRFGNVLGSSGSVVPVFQKQIEMGGPLTVTDPVIERYFMTIPEACELVLHAAAHGVSGGTERGVIEVLDMGEPVRIVDIARQLIVLNGKRPEADIQIRFVGLRPGEKLTEELFDANETRVPGSANGLLTARSVARPLGQISRTIDELERLARSGERPELLEALARAVPGYLAPVRDPIGNIAA